MILRKEIAIVGIWNSSINDYPKNEWQVVLQEFKKENNFYAKLITHKVSVEQLKELLTEMHNKKIFPVKAMFVNEEI